MSENVVASGKKLLSYDSLKGLGTVCSGEKRASKMFREEEESN